MQSIQLKSRIGSDGILHLEIPVGLTEQDLEVMVIFQVIESKGKTEAGEGLGWPPDFFEKTAGSISNQTFIRYPQGELQEREPLD